MIIIRTPSITIYLVTALEASMPIQAAHKDKRRLQWIVGERIWCF